MEEICNSAGVYRRYLIIYVIVTISQPAIYRFIIIDSPPLNQKKKEIHITKTYNFLVTCTQACVKCKRERNRSKSRELREIMIASV